MPDRAPPPPVMWDAIYQGGGAQRLTRAPSIITVFIPEGVCAQGALLPSRTIFLLATYDTHSSDTTCHSLMPL